MLLPARSRRSQPAMLLGAVAIWVRERKCVWKMPHFADASFLQEHFHNVEPELDGRIAEQAQIIQSGLGEEPALVFVHGRGRAHPIFARTGFYFHKDEAVAVAEYQIELATFGTEVRGEEFQPETREVLAGGALAKLAMAQIERELCGRVGLDGLEEAHGVKLNRLNKLHG